MLERFFSIWMVFQSWMTNTRAILQFLNDLEAWNFSHVNTSKNMHAIRIEESATKDNRTQSYIAYGYSMVKSCAYWKRETWSITSFGFFRILLFLALCYDAYGYRASTFCLCFHVIFLSFVLYTLVSVWHVVGTPPFDYDEYFSVKKKDYLNGLSARCVWTIAIRQ